MGRLDFNQLINIEDKLVEVTGQIAVASQGKKYSEIELQRLLRDLEIANSRLISREYNQSNFQPRNVLSIPDRTDELFKDLTFYWSIGQIWKEIIERTFDNTTYHVAEIGCGHIPKVGIGLIYSKFSGTLDLLDLDPIASSQASSFLEFFGSRFSSYPRALSLFTESGQKYDALLANHILDDLILFYFCEQTAQDSRELYSDEQLYSRIWQEISENSDFLSCLAERLAHALLSKLNPGGLILLLDYPSFSHRALGLLTVLELVEKFKSMLVDKLASSNAINLGQIIDGKLSYDRLEIQARDLICFKSGRTLL